MRRLIYGDTATDLIVTVKNEDGTAHDLTGATTLSLKWKASNGVTGTISGTVVVAANGTIRFEDPGNAADPGTMGNVLRVQGVVQWTVSAETRKGSELVEWEILKWF